MIQRVDLCGRRANVMREGYKVRKVAGGADCKVNCGLCGRRRYGGTYEVEKLTRPHR